MSQRDGLACLTHAEHYIQDDAAQSIEETVHHFSKYNILLNFGFLVYKLSYFRHRTRSYSLILTSGSRANATVSHA